MQQVAVGRLRHRREELPLLHLGLAEADVGRDVLEEDPAAEGVLDPGDLRRRHAHGLRRERQGQQVVAVAAAEARPAQVVRDERGLHPVHEPLEPAEVRRIRGLGRARRERHSVEGHGVVPADGLQYVEGPTSVHHEVLGDHLEPGDGGPFGEHRVRRPRAPSRRPRATRRRGPPPGRARGPSRRSASSSSPSRIDVLAVAPIAVLSPPQATRRWPSALSDPSQERRSEGGGARP